MKKKKATKPPREFLEELTWRNVQFSGSNRNIQTQVFRGSGALGNGELAARVGRGPDQRSVTSPPPRHVQPSSWSRVAQAALPRKSWLGRCEEAKSPFVTSCQQGPTGHQPSLVHFRATVSGHSSLCVSVQVTVQTNLSSHPRPL